MSKTTTTSFVERIEKASKYLDITTKKLTSILKNEGIDDIELLDANTTTFIDMECILTESNNGKAPRLKIKMASSILKGDDPLADKKEEIRELPNKKSDSSVLADLIKSQRPLPQRSDEEILKEYITTDREDLESELQRRAKNRPFVIMKEDSKNEVDIDASLVMLKKARKEIIPSSYQTANKKLIRIYKIEEYHKDNRVRNDSPIRPGVTLFDGFCPVSNQNFTKVSDSARKMLRLIYNDLGEQSRLDETRLVEVAENEGVEGLGKIFPEIYETYLNWKETDNLPSLKVLAPLESKKADPFHIKNNHRTY